MCSCPTISLRDFERYFLYKACPIDKQLYAQKSVYDVVELFYKLKSSFEGGPLGCRVVFRDVDADLVTRLGLEISDAG